jgi:lipopolysaccharide/colanic/teichoic acid biosynthesis glycosyltransferase
VQTLLSRALGVAALAFTAPVFAVVALALRSTGSGGVFHQRTRVGTDGRPVRTRAFRIDDTPFGAWLYRLRIDDLPILLDVATGTARLVIRRPPSGRVNYRSLAITVTGTQPSTECAASTRATAWRGRASPR